MSKYLIGSVLMLLLTPSFGQAVTQNQLRQNQLRKPPVQNQDFRAERTAQRQQVTEPIRRPGPDDRPGIMADLVGTQTRGPIRTDAHNPQRDYATKNDNRVARAAYDQQQFQDGNVAPAIYNQAQQPLAINGQPNLIGTAQTPGVVAPSSLDLVKKISMNLVFILTTALGVLLVARRWIVPGAGTSKNQENDDSLRVRESLKLDAKTTIRLVEWRKNRFLVACDQNGIQSVNTLNSSFDQTLSEMDPDDEIDEQKLDGKMIRMLLADLDSNKA